LSHDPRSTSPNSRRRPQIAGTARHQKGQAMNDNPTRIELWATRIIWASIIASPIIIAIIAYFGATA